MSIYVCIYNIYIYISHIYIAYVYRWDTHSWLPLLPASGLLCQGQHTDVLGFAVEPSQRERLAAWSQAYMETVAQQRVRWSAFLGANHNKKTLQDSTRHRLKLLMRLGVPPELRHRVWRLTTGSFAKQRRAAVRR